MTIFQRFLDDDHGDAAIQYALVAALVSLVVLAGSLAVREPLVDIYTDVGDQTHDVLVAAPAPAAGPTE